MKKLDKIIDKVDSAKKNTGFLIVSFFVAMTLILALMLLVIFAPGPVSDPEVSVLAAGAGALKS